MLGFLTHMLSLTSNPLSQPSTELMREKRRDNIYSASVMWNTALFPHLCSPLPVEWPRKHLFFFYKRLASLLSELHEQTYSTTMAWLRCVLSFSLLRSSILCFRGHRSVVGKPIRANLHLPVDVIRAESSWSPLG